MTTEIKTLRVSAEMDASKMASGAQQLAGAVKTATGAVGELGVAVTQTQAKISLAGDPIQKLSKQYIDGFGAQQRFAQGLGVLQRNLETGKVSIETASQVLVGMHQKLGLTADSSMFVARNQSQMAEAIGMANTTIAAQTGALSRQAGEWQIYIAGLKEAQAEQNRIQSSSANQNKFNQVLGVQTQPVSGAARTSASAFTAGFEDIEQIAGLKAKQIGQNFTANLEASLVTGASKSASDAASVFSTELDRIDQIAQQKAAQIGANFQSDLNASLGVGGTGGSARASASVFEEAAREADQMAASVARLRAEINPLGAAQDRLNAELAEYNNLAAKGLITTEELAQAQTMARARASQNDNRGGLARFGAMNATSQLQDIAITSAMGQSPLTIALQQGSQLGMAMETQLAGKAATAGNIFKSIGGAVMGLVTSTNLWAIGLTAAAAIAIQFGSKLFDSFKSAEEKARDFNKLLSEQKDIIQSLGPAYEEMSRQRSSATTPENPSLFQSVGVGRLELEKNLADARKLAEEQAKAALKEMRGSSGTFLGLIGALPEGVQSALGRNQSAIEFDRIVDSATKGNLSINETRTALERFGQTHPDFSYTIGRFLEMSEAAAKAGIEVAKLTGMLDQMNKIRLPEHGFLPLVDTVGAQTLAAQNRMQAQFAADNLATNARSPQELAAAASARTALNPQGSAAEQATREELAGKRALIDAEHALKEAQDQRQRSLEQTMASARLDVELVGKTTAEIEGLRMAAQLEAQVREEAARNHIKADEAEIASIRAKAAEYGKLKAQEEAATQIKSQQDALELQRAEIGSVGQNKLAHDALIESLKTEQEIRKLGIDSTGAQAEALRANTAAASANAEALAHANMQADLMFERRQILRNPEDASIASALRSAGLPEDLSSQEAQMMRYNMALQETKDNFKGFFTDMFAGLKEGKSLWDSFKDAAVNALSKIADKLIDRGLDGIFNSLFGGDQANSGGGLLGQLLGTATGAPAAANQNNQSGGGGILSSLFGGRAQSVASMNVQAAVVNVNGGVGGVGGGLSDILSKLGGSSFKADTTLTDILTGGGGGGAANQNNIQSRIDQAFSTTSAGLGGIFTPSGGFASATGGGSALSQLFQSAGTTRTGIPLSGIGIDGLTAKVASDYAGRFQGLLNDLKSAGYPITSLGEGGYSYRNVAGTNNLSNHAFGNALDINPRQNPWAVGSRGDFSRYGVDPNALAEKNGLFWGGNWNKADPMHFQVNKNVDMGATSSIAKLGDASSKATSALGSLGSGANSLGSGLNQLGSSLNQFPAAPGGGSTGGGIGSWIGSLFGGGGGGSLFGSGASWSSMSQISPMATADIASGSWGLFADGGWTGNGGRNQPAGVVHRGEIVWSQSDIARAGGVGAVEGMRRGVAGYASGGYADRLRMRGGSQKDAGFIPPAANDHGNRHNAYAGYDPTAPESSGKSRIQNINNTNNFIFRENPTAVASQNQIAAKSAKALERLQRTA